MAIVAAGFAATVPVGSVLAISSPNRLWPRPSPRSRPNEPLQLRLAAAAPRHH